MELSLNKKLQGFQLIAQEKLQAIICSIPGRKDLILDQSLIKPLEHICAASWLKLKGIQRIFKFDTDAAIPHVSSELAHQGQVQVFMIRSRLDLLQRVLGHIHEHESLHPTNVETSGIKSFHIICVPSCFGYFRSILEEEGLYGLAQLHRFNWDFIYLDQGVLSMEVANVFPAVYIREDTSLLPAIAQSLRSLQMMCGRPELLLTFGEHATNIVRMLETLGPWAKNSSNNEEAISDFSTLIIMDRDRDYASSLLTPAIYAGLLLEVFNKRAGELEIEMDGNEILRQKLKIFLLPKYQEMQKKNTNHKDSKAASVKAANIRLNSTCDEIYGDNRYKHFAQASSLIRAQAKAIGVEVQKLNDMKLDEMHDYVARKLPKITELKAKLLRHLNASEKVIEMLAGNFRRVQSLEEDILNNVSRKRILMEIDELLTIDGQQYNTLRLLCLLHLCAGITSEELTQFIRNYCNYFGLQHVHVFQELARAGLLPQMVDEGDRLNKSATKLLSNLPIPKFQQTEFRANANRLKLLVSSAGAEAMPTVNNGGNTDNNTSKGAGDGGGSGGGACPSYVFNGLYIPLAAQLCSFLLKSSSADDFSNKLGVVDKIEMHINETNGSSSHAFTTFNAKSYAAAVKQSETRDLFPLRQRNILVFVIGGVTYAEIGACDLVARLTGSQIVVASDSIISGGDLIAGAFKL